MPVASGEMIAADAARSDVSSRGGYTTDSDFELTLMAPDVSYQLEEVGREARS